VSLADGRDRTRVFADVVDRGSLPKASVRLSVVEVFVHPDRPNRTAVADQHCD
jgi:hypothetical protein